MEQRENDRQDGLMVNVFIFRTKAVARSRTWDLSFPNPTPLPLARSHWRLMVNVSIDKP